eukprot:COSAG02_NODE_5386_length_4374_cov_6.152047_2_plen_86_part_01
MIIAAASRCCNLGEEVCVCVIDLFGWLQPDTGKVMNGLGLVLENCRWNLDATFRGVGGEMVLCTETTIERDKKGGGGGGVKNVVIP